MIKKVYQLFITLDNGAHFNLLYGSHKRALYDSKNCYAVGMQLDPGVVVDNSIETRYLF